MKKKDECKFKDNENFTCYRCEKGLKDNIFLLPFEDNDPGLFGVFCSDCAEIQREENYKKNPSLKTFNDNMRKLYEKPC